MHNERMLTAMIVIVLAILIALPGAIIVKQYLDGLTEAVAVYTE